MSGRTSLPAELPVVLFLARGPDGQVHFAIRSHQATKSAAARWASELPFGPFSGIKFTECDDSSEVLTGKGPRKLAGVFEAVPLCTKKRS